MLIKTINERKEEQWWEVAPEIAFVYITNHTHLSPPMVEKELDKVYFELEYNKITLKPIIDPEKPLNWDNIRGNDNDKHPFTVRKKPLGIIQFRIYATGSGPEMHCGMRSSRDPWNFTSKQREVINKLYIPQLLPIVQNESFLPSIRSETIKLVLAHLLEQVTSQRAFLDKVQVITQLEKYK